jgi:putative membrane protein
MWGDFGAHMGWMWLWWIIGLGVLVLFVWAIARATGPSTLAPPAGREESPETILKRRYARGEIDHEEYERRLTDLRK